MKIDKAFVFKEIKEWSQSILIALLLTLMIRAFVIQAFKIPSGSMRPTLIEGDKLFVNKYIYRFERPKRGDIVVFKFPYSDPIFFHNESILVRDGRITVDEKELANPPFFKKAYYELVYHFLGEKDYIKRLVAFEGEDVEIKNNQIYINSNVQNDPTTFGKFVYYNHGPYANPNEKVKVPADSYFVLGDNSANSTDSRFWGFVPKKNMVGKAVFRWWATIWPLWPPENFKNIKNLKRIGPIK